MFGIVRAIRRADEVLLERVFQPLVDYFIRAENARYWLAAAPISLWAIGWLTGLVFFSVVSTQTGTSMFLTLVGSVSGYVLIANTVKHDRFAMSLGIDGYNPHHVFFGSYRLAASCLSLACSIFAAFGFGLMNSGFFATWAMAYLFQFYFLSCEDPRPGRRRPHRARVPSGPAPTDRIVRAPTEPADVP